MNSPASSSSDRVYYPWSVIPRQGPMTRLLTGTLPYTHQNQTHRLGLIRGVLLPTLEFQWSVLIFVRFGWLVGKTGWIMLSVWTVLLAAVMALTAGSLASIVTNELPRGQVLRILIGSLGRGMGVAIACLYLLGLVALMAVELVGSVEALVNCTKFSLVHPYWDAVILAFLSLLICLVVAVSPDRPIHIITVAFLAILLVAILSMIIGIILFDDMPSSIFERFKETLWPSHDYNLRDVMSFIIPCFIGLFSGVNNALNLERPFYSLAWGPLMAIGISFTLYMTIFTLLALFIPRQLLVSDSMIAIENSWPSMWFVTAGVYCVGLGASLQCLLIAASILKSLASEEIMPRSLDWIGLYRESCHRRPVIASCLVALLCAPMLFFVDLEILAMLATSCFLLCYGSTNFACYLLSAFKSPNWRPHFIYHHWSLALIGMLGCLGILLHLAFYTTIISVFAVIMLSYFIQTSSDGLSWGYGFHGLLFDITLKYLIAAEHESFGEKITNTSLLESLPLVPDVDITNAPEIAFNLTPSGRTWRPQIVSFVKLPDTFSIENERLFEFISQLKSRSSLCILSHIITKDQLPVIGEDGIGIREYRHYVDHVILERRLRLQRAMEQHNISGFTKVFTALSNRTGQRVFLQTMGLGELTPNTIVMDWPQSTSHENNRTMLLDLQDLWQLAKRMSLSCLLVKGLHLFPSNHTIMIGDIDVWWIVQEGHLLLLTAYLLKQNAVWSRCKIRLFALCHITDNFLDIEREIGIYLNMLRIHVESVTIVPIEIWETPPTEDHEIINANRILRDEIIQQKLANELKVEHQNIHIDPAAFENICQSTSSFQKNDEEQDHNRYPPLLGPSNSRSRPSWVPSSDIGEYHGEITLFVHSKVIRQLKYALEHHSRHSALVIFNLPAPETREQLFLLDDTKMTGIYMELVEWITSEIPRSILIHAGTLSDFPLQ